MLNRNQKRFRKEISKIQSEERKNGSKEPVISYIKGDYIEYYSSPQRKIEKGKTKGKISIVSILAGSALIYSLYTWFAPVSEFVHSLTNIKSISAENAFPAKSAPFIPINPIHERMIKYLKYVESLDQEMNPLVTYITAEAMQNKHPEEMEEFYQTVIQKYKSISKASVYASTAVLNRDRQVDSQFRIEMNNLNLLRQQQLSSLTKAFDRAGIKWEKTENGITYHVKGL